jgi:hypothetical protein
MWTQSDKKLFRALAVFVLLGLPVLDRALPAQTPAASAPADQQALRQTLEQRYEILALRNGVLLKPRQETRGVRSIEVSGESVAINGERVTTGVLRSWLGEDAQPVLRLQAMAPAERRALFGFEDTDAAAAGEARDEDEDVPPDTSEEMDTGDEPAELPPAVPAPPAPPGVPDSSTTHLDSQVNVGGGITVDKGEVAEEAVAIGGPVRVDGETLNDAVSVGGSTRIEGRVGGEVVAVLGSVILGPHSEVMGNVTSVGGTVRKAPGAKVHGSISNVALGQVFREGLHGRDRDIDLGPFIFSPLNEAMEFFWSVMSSLVLALLVCLVLLVARQPLERVDAQLAAEPGKSAVAGVLAFFLSLPLLALVSILLVLTIVGCVLFLLYPFLFLALMLLALLGYSAVAYRVGRWMEFRFDRRFGSPYLVALVGVATIQIWTVLGRLIGLGGGPLDFIGGMLLAFGVLVQLAAWVVGFGAVLLSRFGAGPRPLYPVMAAPVTPPPAPPVYEPASYEPPPAPAGPSALPEAWEGPSTGPGGES